MAERSNVSDNLVWQITRGHNAFQVKRRSGGGSRFSRDPLNPASLSSFKYAGYANSKAIGIQATENGGVTVLTKRPGSHNQPAKSIVSVVYGPNTSTRKIYKGVANKTAKSGYRADLRADAVARTSAIRKSQRPKRESPAKKLRGAAAREAAAKAEEGA